jgi:predicted TIM-barrel fold metal-dependent hydrolase
MDHTGGAIAMGLYEGRREVAFEEWRTAIRILAKAPNAHAKIGGFGMRLWGFRFYERPIPPSSEELAAAIRPYVETCIEAFGPSRCMFESNFPVDKGSFGYAVLWNAYKRLVQNYSDDERDMLFRGTAERVYRLAK